MSDETYFKIYMSDVGLLCRRSNIDYETIINGDDNFIHFKGALTENYVLTELINLGIRPFFWRSGANAEVDFITDRGGKLLPIEVKAADNTKAKSLTVFCNRYRPKEAIKTSLKNAGVIKTKDTVLRSVPLYALMKV